MRNLVSSIVKKIRPSFDEMLREAEDNRLLYMLDEELGDRASCCTQGEVACFYVLDWTLHGGDGKQIAARLVEELATRQLPEGAFSQPYYVKKGETGTVDIAEIGAVANSLYHVHKATGNEAAVRSLKRTADYLITQIAAENPGAVYKNPNAMQHDVLNGDVYAAHTWGRTYELLGHENYLKHAIAVMEHVSSRFGKHEEGWWPYIELWNGDVGMGNSVAYQGTIVGFADTLIPLLPDSLRLRWGKIAKTALQTMLQQMDIGPNDHNEAPWWCRDWNNAWEIYLAFSRFSGNDEAHRRLMKRLSEVEEQLASDGIALFTPQVQVNDPDRTPVTTTFRKAATFAGILSYMYLDKKKSV